MQMKMDDIKDWNDDDNVFGSIGNIATPPSSKSRSRYGLAASSGNDAFAPSASRRNSQASDYPTRNLPAPPMQASKPKTSSSRDISTATSALGKPTAASLQSSSCSDESSQETTMSTRKTQTIKPGCSLSINNRPSTSTPIDVIRSFHAPEKRSESIEQIRKSGSYREAHTDSLATLSKASNQSKMRNTSSRQSPPDATEMKKKLETQTRVRQKELEMTKKSSSETAYNFQPNTLSEGVQKRVQVSQKTYGGNNASQSLRSNIAPTSMRSELNDDAQEFLTSNNGQPRKQGQTVKKVKVPEVLDLVSDEDENQDQSNAMPNPSENMEDNMTVAEYLEYSHILKQFMQPFDSKIMPPSELESRPTWTTVSVDGDKVEYNKTTSNLCEYSQSVKCVSLKRQLFNAQNNDHFEMAKRAKLENDRLLQDNQQLRQQTQDMQHLLRKVKEECINEKRKAGALQEENHRLSSQVFLWQQMHLSSNPSQDAGHTMISSTNEHKEEEEEEDEDLPDVELQSSPIAQHGEGNDSPVLPMDD